MTRLQQLRTRLEPLQAGLLGHSLYQHLGSLPALRRFMEHHVFAVWDFMSLLKELQRRLCCVDVPWVPSTNPAACRFINAVVLAEESDEDGHGGFISHFGLYHQAMLRCGADTTAIDRFLDELRRGAPVDDALDQVDVPDCVRRFVLQTFAFISGGDLCAIASAFTFGREDLLPGLFGRIVDELNAKTSGDLEDFKYYLHRHIGLDGQEHGPEANRFLESLCGADEHRWQIAEHAAVTALQARLDLWDGMLAAVRR